MVKGPIYSCDFAWRYINKKVDNLETGCAFNGLSFTLFHDRKGEASIACKKLSHEE